LSVTYGFYNSVNGDRKYDAIQVSSIFDGIVKDGIFMSIGTSFRVKAASGMTVNVGVGRAWFNHTWTYNNAILPLTLGASSSTGDRIDSVILEVNATESVRVNSIKVLKGTVSSSPKAPTLTNTSTVHQYRLANISVKANAKAITQSMITDLVGTGSAPYITGILKTVNTDDLIAQWQSEWEEYIRTQEQDSAQWVADFENDLALWKTAFERTNNTWSNTQKENFRIWFAGIQSAFGSEDVAGALQLEIDSLKYRQNTSVTFNSNGSITEVSDAATVNTVFNSDGSITESYQYKNGIRKTVKTTFSANGVNYSVE